MRVQYGKRVRDLSTTTTPELLPAEYVELCVSVPPEAQSQRRRSPDRRLFAFLLLSAILYLMKKEVKLKELPDFVKGFLSDLNNNVVGLYGNLGAGKTTFVKEVAKQLGVEEEITSPTFTIQKTYELSGQKFKKLVHIDLYRIEDLEEIKILNLEELFKEKESLILIEWIDKIEDELNDNFLKLEIEHKDDDSRIFEIKNA